MERRSYPRLHTRFPAEVVGGGKRSADKVMAADVSITGLQLVCDQKVANRIVARADKGNLKAAKPCQVRVTLPLKDGSHVQVDARCIVRLVRKTADGEYRVGVEYDFFEGKSYAALEAFIDDWVRYPDEA